MSRRLIDPGEDMSVFTRAGEASEQLPASPPIAGERRVLQNPQGNSAITENHDGPTVGSRRGPRQEFRFDPPVVTESSGSIPARSIGSRIMSRIVSIGSRLGPTEWRRRAWHIAPGFLPFALWGTPHSDPLSLRVRTIFVVLIFGLAITIYRRYDRIRRQGEHGGQLGTVIGYAGSILATFLLLPAHAEIGMAVVAILAFGDGSATMFGRLLGGAKLPWNRAKTWAGSLAFVLIGGPMASVVYWGESHNLYAQTPGVSVWTAAVCGGVPVLMAALAESISSRVNDNIRVGITAAVSVTAVHAMMVGL